MTEVTIEVHIEDNHETKQKTWKIIIVGVLTLLFCITEFVVGFLTGSLAILSDAFHMVSDFIAIVISFIALRLTSRQPTKTMTYGWKRAEIIGGYTNAIFLLSVSLFITLEAINRFIFIEIIEHPIWIVGIGGGGLLINIIGILLLCGEG